METKKSTSRFLFASWQCLVPCLLIVLLATGPALAVDQTFAWLDQFGTAQIDYGFGVAANGGNIYVGGTTSGSLGGSNVGSYDAFLCKYSTTGNTVWSAQIGTSGMEQGRGVATDNSGNAYISGHTEGSFPGATNAGGWDAFVSKYDASGTPLWTSQLGSSGIDESYGVATDSLGNVYIAGRTNGSLGTGIGGFDAYLSKFSPAGTLLWTKQVGTGGTESGNNVVVDNANNVYLTGFTTGVIGASSVGGIDGFVTKFDGAGTVQWTSQIGSSGNDFPQALASDGLGNIYITGQTDGQFVGATSAGSRDGFVGKIDSSSGTLQWVSQFGGSNSDFGYDVSADSLGNLYVAGYTWGTVEGSSFGGYDALLGKFDPVTGSMEWIDQFGTGYEDECLGISTDGWGNAYFTGYTVGTLGPSSNGSYDAYLGKISVPEPSTFMLLLLGLSSLLLVRRK